MRNSEKVYQVIEGEKVIFEGTARDICVHFKGEYNAHDVRNIYRMCQDNQKFLKKYLIKFKEKHKAIIEIRNKKTNEVFVGTTEQVAKKLWFSETYVLRTARTNGRLLHEWIAKVVEN